MCDIVPKQRSEWPAEVTSWFTTYTEKKPLQVTVIEDTKANFKVVLYEQLPHSDVCVNALLVKQGHANSIGEKWVLACSQIEMDLFSRFSLETEYSD